MSRAHGALAAVRSREGDRVTTLELFFDLAFVFAFTQLSRLMAQEHDVVGVLQAMTILGLLWWSWNSYAWLGNLAHADRGWIRPVMLVATASMFLVGITVLEAYRDLAGGLFGPLVFVCAYLAARVAHAAAFTAVSVPRLRRRAFLTTSLSVVPSGVLLVVGALTGGIWQLGLWLAAVALEPVVTQRTSTGVEWHVGSAEHFTERHGLIVILAIGESMIAIGTGVAQEPMSGPILLGITAAFVLAAGFWWAYFSRLARQAEHALHRDRGAAQAMTARDGYTYLHLLVIAGIVFAALGIEEALAHIGAGEPLGWFTAAALGGGIGVYLAATVWFARRVTRRLLVVRAIGAILMAASVPALAVLAPLPALLLAASCLVVVLAIESSMLATPAAPPRPRP